MDSIATSAEPGPEPGPEPGHAPVATEIRQLLIASLAPTKLDLEDQSDHHIGHAGHDDRGESHFALVIECATFTGMNRVQRQRAVYAALGELMDNRVHALTIRAVAPGEQ